MKSIPWISLFVGLSFFVSKPACGTDFQQINSVLPSKREDGRMFYAGLKYWNRTRPKDGPFLVKMVSIADHLGSLGQTEAAILWYRLALHHTYINGKNYRLRIFNQLGALFHYKGDMVTALSMYRQAYRWATDSIMGAQILVNQSNVYQSLKNYKKALEVLENSLPTFVENDIYVWMAICNGSQAIIYKQFKNYSKAAALNLKALHAINSFQSMPDSTKKRSDKKEAIDIRGRILGNLAEIYLELKLPDSAYFYLSQISHDFDQLTRYTCSGIHVSYGKYYQQKNQADTAISILLHALAAIEKGEFNDFRLTVAQTLSELYEKKQNFKQAFYWQNEYLKLKDSLTSFENVHRIHALETQYYLSEKDKLLAQKELKITQQHNKLQRRNWMMSTAALVVVAVLLILIISRRSYRNKQRLLKGELKESRQQQKLSRMEAMIDGEIKERTRIAKELHDSVVNEVLALKLNLTDLGKDFSVLRYAPKFKSVLHQSEEVAMRLRETAHNLLPAKIRENGLFNTIAAFIEKINAPVHFTFQHYGTLPPLEAEAERIILLSVLELIQNVLKHARASEALVQLNYFEDVLSITVEDDGVGLPPESQSNEDKGIGLQGILENMEMLGATIDFQSGEYTGTTVLIEIPLAGFKLQRENLHDAI